jgi:hypothetical protein
VRGALCRLLVPMLSGCDSGEHQYDLSYTDSNSSSFKYTKSNSD